MSEPSIEPLRELAKKYLATGGNPADISDALQALAAYDNKCSDLKLMTDARDLYKSDFDKSAAECRSLRAQFAALTKDRDRYEKALGEWEEREAKVCPENVSFESVIAAITKELSSTRDLLKKETAIVDRVWKALGILTYDQAKPFAIDEHVTRTIDRLHALEQGVKVAVEALDMVWDIEEMGYTVDDPESESGVCTCNKCEAVLPHGGHSDNCPQPIIKNAIAHLTPLLTTPTKGGACDS